MNDKFYRSVFWDTFLVRPSMNFNRTFLLNSFLFFVSRNHQDWYQKLPLFLPGILHCCTWDYQLYSFLNYSVKLISFSVIVESTLWSSVLSPDALSSLLGISRHILKMFIFLLGSGITWQQRIWKQGITRNELHTDSTKETRYSYETLFDLKDFLQNYNQTRTVHALMYKD